MSEPDRFVTVVYCLSNTVFGRAIQNADRLGRWSHCGLVMPYGTVIEATFFGGVVETSSHAFKARYAGRTSYQHIACPNPAGAQAWAKDQVGKRYDWLAVLGGLCRTSWQEDDAWQCAELVESALVVGGARRFRDAPNRISPNISYMVV